MDVRCEKCRTEYELDESKLKPGGVTVKCTSCGHMFKVRRRITAIGPAVSGPPTLRQPPEDEHPTQPVRTKPPSLTDEGRTWLVRLEDGEILACRELATLQKWIAAGRVSRVCQISRSGKKWKPLGEIGELASFFQIADEAREAAGKLPAPPARTLLGHPNVVSRPPTASGAAAAPIQAEPAPMMKTKAQQSSSPPVGGRTLGPGSAPPPPARGPSPSPSPMLSRTVPPTPAVIPAGPPAGVQREGRATGEWQGGGAAGHPRQIGPSGPVRGMERAPSQAEAEFARMADRRGEFENGAFVPTDDFPSSPGSAGRFIAMFSIAVILAGLAILYFVVFRDNTGNNTGNNAGNDTENNAETIASEGLADASATIGATALDASLRPSIDPADVDAVLTEARKRVEGDSFAGLEVSLGRIEELGDDARKQQPVMGALATLHAAIAQHQLDESRDLKRASAKQRLVGEARKHAATAEDLGKQIFASDSSNMAALVALANSLRLRDELRKNDRPSSQGARYLRKALKIDGNNRDALLARALLFIRDDNPRKAKNTLEDLVKNSPASDVRAAYRLSLLYFDDSKFDRAKANLDKVLAAEPQHPGAARLVKKLAAAEAKVPESGGDDSGGRSGGSDEPSNSVDSYDRLLAKADSAAEKGSCSKAIGLYERALDLKPSGVAALTGLGFCYLDSSRYSSAHSKFRAALGVSSRYQDAMWGMAELYERQGNRPQAISRYQKFVDAHPGSRRATTARKKIEQLGGSSSGSGSGGSGSGDSKTTGETGGSDKQPDTGSGSGADSGGDAKPTPTPSPL